MLRIWFLKAPRRVLRHKMFVVSFWRFRISFPFFKKKVFEEMLVNDCFKQRRNRTEMHILPIGFKKIVFSLSAENKVMHIKIRVGYNV